MITWTRCAEAQKICGGPCSVPIRRGAPMLLIASEHRKRTLIRCAACAKHAGYGEPPPDLPPIEERQPITPMLKVAHVGAGALPLDWKTAQSGDRELQDREPGCDDN